MTTRILERSQAGIYGDLFKSCPNGLAQQSLEWADVISPISPDTPYFIVGQSGGPDHPVDCGLPLFYFESAVGGILTSVPHAGPLGGCLVDPLVPRHKWQDVYRSLFNQALSLARDLSCLSLTIITNPFCQDASLYQAIAEPNYLLSNFCQIVPLDKIIFGDHLKLSVGRSSFNNDIRRNLTKARDRGILVRWADKSEFSAWYQIHLKRQNQLAAAPIPKELLYGILNGMRDSRKGNLAIAFDGDKIVGGCFYIWHMDFADAYIMSSDSDFFQFGINYALTEFSMREFKRINIKYFNWQSCERNSGVYNFKSRWGGIETPYEILTWTFSGFAKLFELSVSEIRSHFPWHYVAPYEAFQQKVPKGQFLKK